MPTVVGTLQVDLVANTATFSYDLGQAGDKANEFGKKATEGFGSAREGAMLLEEATGVRLPRALTHLLSNIGPLGAAFQAMLPVAGVVAAIGIISELVHKHQEAMEKLREAEENFGLAGEKVFASLDDKLLEAGIKADELAHDHLGALSKELTLIDHASLKELVTTFDILGKAADAVFAQIQAHWYTWGEGSRGAQNALHNFQAQYAELLAKLKDKEAADLLAGTLQAAENHLSELQRLKATGLGFGTDNEIKAQEKLVSILQDQVTVQGKVAELKAAQQDNAATETGNKIGDDQDKALKAQADAAKQAAQDEQKAWDESFRAAVSGLQDAERAKIEATRAGSQARIDAIDAAIKEENSKGLQETAVYKSLQLEKVQAVRARAEQEEKITADLAKAELENSTKMAELANAAEDRQAKFSLAMRQSTAEQAMNAEIDSENRKYAAQQQANDKEVALLMQNAEKNRAALAQAYNREEQQAAEHENKLTDIQESAEEQRVRAVTNAENRMAATFAQTAARSIMEGQNMAQSFERVGQQMAEAALANLLQLETVQGRRRFSDARTAAADAFASAGNPFTGAIEAAVAFSAVMAFEGGGIVPGMGNGDSVHAMLTPEEMVLPKSISIGLQRMMSAGEFNGGSNGGGDMHFHYAPTNHLSMIDATGVDKMLEEHGESFERHSQNVLRKRNL